MTASRPARADHCAQARITASRSGRPTASALVALRAPRQARVEHSYGSGAVLDLVWLPAEGGDATVISPARGASGPHFTREADRIYMTTPQGLVSMRFDGTDRRTHLAVTGKTGYSPSEPEPAEQIVLSPDGRWALARVTNQLYLLALPRFGGEAPKVSVHEPSVPLKKLTDIGADYAAWADGGKTITWAIGASFFRLPFDSIVFPRSKAKTKKRKIKKKPKRKRRHRSPSPEEVAVVIEQPRHRPRGTVVLSGAKVVTMRGDEVIPEGDIVVTDHRIVAVGQEGFTRGPRGSQGHRCDGQYDRSGLHRHAPSLDGG